MNPLLFADWGRLNRLFTKIMWAVVVVMACVVFVVLVSAGPRAHTASTPRAAVESANPGASR